MIKTILCLILFCFNLVFAADNSTAAIQKRIEPVGQVNIASEPAKPANAVTEKATAKPDEKKATVQAQTTDGKAIYDKYCFICHKSGATGAPKLGDKAAWKPRIAKGMEKLDEHAMKGFNAMPPKGTCAKCTDAQLKATVEYIVNQSKE